MTIAMAKCIVNFFRKKCFYGWVGLCLLWSCQSSRSAFESKAEALRLFEEGKLTEGPAIGPEGHLYFSDQPNDVIRKLTPDGKVEVVLQPSGVANGLAFDQEGRLLICQSNSGNYPEDAAAGKRRIVRYEKDGTLTVMAAEYRGKPFIGPNDLCVDAQGRIYFTDPYYPDSGAEKSQPYSGVYRIDAPGEVTLVVRDLQKPNGILITPDQHLMYISDRGTQLLHRYQVQPDGSLTPAGVVFRFPDRGIDGMAIDTKGLLYGAAGEGETTGVYVIDPYENKLIDFKPFPATAYNVCFGGAEGSSLYVCAGGSVYLLKTKNQGVVLPVAK